MVHLAPLRCFQRALLAIAWNAVLIFILSRQFSLGRGDRGDRKRGWGQVGRSSLASKDRRVHGWVGRGTQGTKYGPISYVE
jgi:hypothetical protein